MQGYQEEEHVFKVTQKNRLNRDRSHSAFRGQGKATGRRPLNKFVIEYFKCYKQRHFQYECLDQENEANYVELDEEEELMFMSYEKPYQTQGEEIWYLDLGCNNHMIEIKNGFLDLEVEYCKTMKLRNDIQIIVTKKA